MAGIDERRPSLPGNAVRVGEAEALLLTAVAAGNRDAFRALYLSAAPRLLGVCLRVAGERAEAEEALQEAFLAVWRRASTFDAARGDARVWLAVLARNCAVDRLRARTKLATAPLALAEDVPDDAPLAFDRAAEIQDRARLEACLDTLHPADALLIKAAFMQGSTYSELAQRTGRPLPTVKSRIRRALMRMAECLR